MLNLLNVAGSQNLVVHAQCVLNHEISSGLQEMHENNIYLGPNLLSFLDKIADYGPMVGALIMIFQETQSTLLVNTLSQFHFHFKGISLIGPYFTGCYSVSDLWLLKMDKKHFFPKGYLNQNFFPSDNIFFCALPEVCL